MAERSRDGREYPYAVVEQALADVMGVESAGMGAFRGRIRHLRNIGGLKVPKPGSGRHIAYTIQHAAQFLIALQLEGSGVPPREAVAIAANQGVEAMMKDRRTGRLPFIIKTLGRVLLGYPEEAKWFQDNIFILPSCTLVNLPVNFALLTIALEKLAPGDN